MTRPGLTRMTKIEVVVTGDDVAAVEGVFTASGASGYTVLSSVSGLGHGGFHQGSLHFNDRDTLRMIIGVVTAALTTGGMLVGCGAGFLNGVKIKGAHTAIKTGMLAAESIHKALSTGHQGQSELADFEDSVKASWVYRELHQGRNFGPGLHKLGTFWGGAFAFLDQNIFFGKLPFTWRNTEPDHESLDKASDAQKIEYPKPDGVLTFDKLSSVFLSSTNHEEDQPSHLQLKDDSVPVEYNLPKYDEPAQRYCPAGVYEVVEEDGKDPRFVINFQNCVHCKTCDIKDPSQNINWVCPEGGGGPNYTGM